MSCNSQNNPNTWGSARSDPNAGARAGKKQALAQRAVEAPSPARQRQREEEEEAPLALAAPSRHALAEAGQLHMPAAATALRNLRRARLQMQQRRQRQQPLVGHVAAAELAVPDSTPPLLRAAEQEGRRALANAQAVVPASRQWADAGMFKQSGAAAYMRKTGLRHRLAEVQRNKDNSGFFESPASVVVE